MQVKRISFANNVMVGNKAVTFVTAESEFKISLIEERVGSTSIVFISVKDKDGNEGLTTFANVASLTRHVE